MTNIKDLIKVQKNFFYSGSTLPLKARKQHLKTLKRALIEMEDEFLQALHQDFQKPEFESFISETGYLIKDIDHMLSYLPDWVGRKRVSGSLLSFPSKSYIYHEPYGVCLIISPWNYPLQLAIAPAIGALAAGNTVVIKPSELAPATSAALKKLAHKYFTPEVLAVVEGAVPETQELLEQPVDYLFFTGSPQVGKIMMKAAAEQLLPLTLELGGKSPCIVDKTANLKIAAKRLAQGKFFNCGQTCIAPDYVLIDKSIQDQFVDELKKHIHTFYGDDPKKSDSYARVINHKHWQRLVGYLKDGHIEIGGEFSEAEKYIAPTVMTNVTIDSPVMQDEIFGPILPIIAYSDESEIVPFIRQYSKPLALYHFTTNKKLRETILKNVSFGGGVVNDTLEHLINPELPFGGVGVSGIGAYHGEYSFKTFSHEKSVLQKSSWFDLPLKYPPYDGKLKLLRNLFKIS